MPWATFLTNANMSKWPQSNKSSCSVVATLHPRLDPYISSMPLIQGLIKRMLIYRSVWAKKGGESHVGNYCRNNEHDGQFGHSKVSFDKSLLLYFFTICNYLLTGSCTSQVMEGEGRTYWPNEDDWKEWLQVRIFVFWHSWYHSLNPHLKLYFFTIRKFLQLYFFTICKFLQLYFFTIRLFLQ